MLLFTSFLYSIKSRKKIYCGKGLIRLSQLEKYYYNNLPLSWGSCCSAAWNVLSHLTFTLFQE